MMVPRGRILPVRRWIVFTAVQIAGYLVPLFANVHTNPGPLFIGVLLLFPGDLVSPVLPQRTPAVLQCVAISGVNALIWSFALRVLYGSANRDVGIFQQRLDLAVHAHHVARQLMLAAGHGAP